MFIAFEGIDGSGKTTISNRVAKTLRSRDIAVTHVREKGEFALPVVSRMREFGKDTRNLELAPLPELLLYAARDAQLLTEAITPALARGDVVFADRYLYSYEVLSTEGRGLPRAQVQGVLNAVANGVWPDLVVLCDVDVNVARARRKVRKLMDTAHGNAAAFGGGSRKGLGGAGLHHRLRLGYLDIAQREPTRWLVIDNSFGELEAVVELVTETVAQFVADPCVDIKRIRKGAHVLGTAPGGPTPVRSCSNKLNEAALAFYDFIAKCAEREPGVAARMLAGLTDARAYDMRERLMQSVPAVIAAGLRGLNEPAAWSLRERLTVDAPYHVARSLHGYALDPARAHQMRLSLLDTQPRAVLASLNGEQTAEAWAIRRRLGSAYPVHTLASVRYAEDAEAWSLREQMAAESGVFSDRTRATALAHSLRGLGCERAWCLRRAVFASAPVAALASLAGVDDDEAWQWRRRWAPRAGKTVLRTLDGDDSPRAWQLRHAHAHDVKETVDSMIGIDSASAWTFRADALARWPATVLKSLVPLVSSERAQNMINSLIEHHRTDLSVLKHATRAMTVQADGVFSQGGA